jgi:hypothetical protein
MRTQFDCQRDSAAKKPSAARPLSQSPRSGIIPPSPWLPQHGGVRTQFDCPRDSAKRKPSAARPPLQSPHSGIIPPSPFFGITWRDEEPGCGAAARSISRRLSPKGRGQARVNFRSRVQRSLIFRGAHASRVWVAEARCNDLLCAELAQRRSREQNQPHCAKFAEAGAPQPALECAPQRKPSSTESHPQLLCSG